MSLTLTRLLPQNPVTMVGRLDPCWLFAYRTPAQEARAFLPPALEPVTHGGFAFWNVVVCRVQRMRPWFAPAPLGVSYWHIAYRLYVRFHPTQGEPIEGLYFVRSDCDSWLMALAGNMVTDFRFHTAAVRVQERAASVDLAVDSPDAPAHARLSRTASPTLGQNSPFATLDEAAARLKYKPFGISVDPERSDANVVCIVRDERAWRSLLVHVQEADWAFFAGQEVQLELCYEVAPIDYQWNRGRRYRARSSSTSSGDGFREAGKRRQRDAA